MRQWITKRFGRRTARKDELECHQVGELLQRYLDGYIDAERARLIEDHLEVCRKCGLEAETYERIKASLAEHRPEVPQDTLERLRDFGERLARGEESTPT
jgi:anti-sigma factor RsiW